MISREMMIGGGALVALLVAGGVAYAASAPAAAAAASSASFVFKKGRRYEVDLEVPPQTTYTPSTMPSAKTVQGSFDALASGAFTVVSVGAEVSGTAAPGSGFKAYFIVDCLKDTTISQADVLAGTPTGTTVTVSDEGLTSAASSGSTKSTGTSSSTTTSTPSTSSGAATVVSTSVIGKPIAGGWETTVTLGPDSCAVSAWPG